MEDFVDPRPTGDDKRFSRDDRGPDDYVGVDEGGGEVAGSDVFFERGSNVQGDSLLEIRSHEVARSVLGRGAEKKEARRCRRAYVSAFSMAYTKKPVWPYPTMLISIGIERNVFVLDARNATRRALAICSGLASTMPRIFF